MAALWLAAALSATSPPPDCAGDELPANATKEAYYPPADIGALSRWAKRHFSHMPAVAAANEDRPPYAAVAYGLGQLVADLQGRTGGTKM